MRGLRDIERQTDTLTDRHTDHGQRRLLRTPSGKPGVQIQLVDIQTIRGRLLSDVKNKGNVKNHFLILDLFLALAHDCCTRAISHLTLTGYVIILKNCIVSNTHNGCEKQESIIPESSAGFEAGVLPNPTYLPP